MTLRLIEWIWHVRGTLPLVPGQSADEAFDRLDPVFHQPGTTHERADDTLTFRKKDPAAQDRLSIFDQGVLRIERGPAGPVLRYHLISRALLYCFLAPLMFLAFAQLTIVIGEHQASTAKASESSKKKDEKKDAVVPMNPIDKALGAPEPENPGKDDKKDDEEGDKPSPTPAYVFAALFAALYVVGRILEAWLVRSLFRKRLLGA